MLTALYEDAKSGEIIFYPMYTEAEQSEMPAKRDTGLFFFRSRAPKRHRTAVCSAGGGFVYVGAIHDSFPHALALSRRGYDAFALIYRPGAKTACEDLARALAFLFAHEQELGISMEGYSLWGGSAGARMSAWLSDYGTGAFGERALPRPAAVVLQYTGLSEVTGREVPTYSCVGDEDPIADCHTHRAEPHRCPACGRRSRRARDLPRTRARFRTRQWHSRRGLAGPCCIILGGTARVITVGSHCLTDGDFCEAARAAIIQSSREMMRKHRHGNGRHIMNKKHRALAAALLAAAVLLPWQAAGEAAPQAAKTAGAVAADTTAEAPLIIAEQGSFAVGGAQKKHEGQFSLEHFLEPTGQTAYGDHAYVYYQKPVQPRNLPLIFEHGGAQTKRTWESTVDGREGFQNIFLRKGYSTYLVDQPRIGEAGLALQADDGKNPYAANPMYADHTMFMLCRIGTYEDGQLKALQTSRTKIEYTVPDLAERLEQSQGQEPQMNL